MSKQVKNYHRTNPSKIIASLLINAVLIFFISAIAFAEGGGRYDVEPWSFGVMGDTQWTVDEDPDEANPEYVSAALARALGDEFIDNGVKFVIQVGDLTDRAGNEGMNARAAAAQPLYDAGIGFFPLRGNHETYGNLYGRDTDHDMNIPAYLAAFPQTQGLDNTFGATNFSSPDIDILNGLSYSFDYNDARFVIVDVEATSYEEIPPEEHPDYGLPYDYIWWVVYKYTAEMGDLFEPGTWFRIDSSGNPSTNFYGFEATYPVDEYAIPAQPKWVSSGSEFYPGDQQDWISTQLDKTIRDSEHAFVFSHRGLMGANHVDCLFGSNPGSKSATQVPFYASLVDNGVRYMISGHDHLHNRAIVASPATLEDGSIVADIPGDYQVEQIISMAASTKFYGPAGLDEFNGNYGDVKQRETQISQELYNVGYYIYTVDGPRVTVDYYSDYYGYFEDGAYYPDGDPYADPPIPGSLSLPDLDFTKKETWGYSTNGKQFLIGQGGSYTDVEDRFGRTRVKILAGTNNSSTTDETPTVIDDNGTPDDSSDDIILSEPRAFTKAVNTGWVMNPDIEVPDCERHRWSLKKLLKALKKRLHGKLKSHIVSLWGMAELGTEQTDTYVLSMSIDVFPTILDFKGIKKLKDGKIGIATYVDDEWVNAVDENFGEGEKNFVIGKYKPEYGLGTYGVDPKTKTAWAVLNYNADFAIAKDIAPAPKQKKNKKRSGR